MQKTPGETNNQTLQVPGTGNVIPYLQLPGGLNSGGLESESVSSLKRKAKPDKTVTRDHLNAELGEVQDMFEKRMIDNRNDVQKQIEALQSTLTMVTQRLDTCNMGEASGNCEERLRDLEAWRSGEAENRINKLEMTANANKKEQSEIKKRVEALERRQQKSLSALEILTKYNQAKIAGARYFSSIFDQARQGILRVDFSQTELLCEYNKTGTLDGEMLGRRIGQRIKVLSRSVKASGKITARIQLDIRPTLRAQAVRAIVEKRAEYKGEFGISIPPAREYNIDMTLTQWKATGLIDRFDISRKGQYVITVAGGGDFRWLMNCPLELIKIPESNLSIDILKKLSDWAKYFTVDGVVLEIPAELRPRNEQRVPRNNATLSGFNGGADVTRIGDFNRAVGGEIFNGGRQFVGANATANALNPPRQPYVSGGNSVGFNMGGSNYSGFTQNASLFGGNRQ